MNPVCIITEICVCVVYIRSFRNMYVFEFFALTLNTILIR